jgi:uncharacterized alkaline shock family protein YloU
VGDTKRDYVTSPDEQGSINISEDVVAAIAVSAALEVDGVAEMAKSGGQPGRSKKQAIRGVKLTVGDGNVIVDLQILVKYGQPIPQVAQNVQEAVVNAVESMTELKVAQVNVRISGVTFESAKEG